MYVKTYSLRTSGLKFSHSYENALASMSARKPVANASLGRSCGEGIESNNQGCKAKRFRPATSDPYGMSIFLIHS